MQQNNWEEMSSEYLWALFLYDIFDVTVVLRNGYV